MKKHVVAYKALSPALLERLREAVDLSCIDITGESGLARLEEALPTAHGLIGSSLKLTPALLDKALQLEAIASISVGYDNYDLDYLAHRGILLSNTPDVLTETVADTAFALILATARRVVELADYVKAGKWQRSIGEPLFGNDVHGKTLGIIGMGRIGSAIARRGRFGFGMPILYNSHSPKPEVDREFSARYCSLDDLLSEADFVCITVPLSEETSGLIGARQLALLKQEAFLINISRGKVVDEAALIEALQAKRFQGAGLDVFEKEPLPSDSPLLNLPQVVATPHIGSATHGTREGMARCAVDNLLAALTGKRPPDLVNPDVWTRRMTDHPK
ncbi:phosphogluconate 2-dehydrogenase [Pseudomonas duriflava]|uniref:Phosphogluconate 2-dehydrogenase n=1 Tax=Pseudomonas duriflava TaxID=459528 RepID=A0A562QFI5_9PSED|nr:NAD(P)-dependent oxidoreductase [Pseudomonas duriflava]TWI55522.1 phosphogluconate 2-dehydrogenase [Pseudomonas duriflava]